jgi:hypothetical protein
MDYRICSIRTGDHGSIVRKLPHFQLQTVVDGLAEVGENRQTAQMNICGEAWRTLRVHDSTSQMAPDIREADTSALHASE